MVDNAVVVIVIAAEVVVELAAAAARRDELVGAGAVGTVVVGVGVGGC